MTKKVREAVWAAMRALGLRSTEHVYLFCEIRKEKGLTQQYLAEKLGVCQTTIAMWETGKSVPTMKNLMRLSELLGVSIEVLCRSFPKNRIE